MPGFVLSADATPDTRGHHSGQLKPQHPRVPAPQPPPAVVPPPIRPNPPAGAPAVPHPYVAIAQTNPPPVSIGLIPPLPDLGGQAAPQKAGGGVETFRESELWGVGGLVAAV